MPEKVGDKSQPPNNCSVAKSVRWHTFGCFLYKFRRFSAPGLVRQVVRPVAEDRLSDECAGQLDVINTCTCGTASGSGPDISIRRPGCQRRRAVAFRRQACGECPKETDAKRKKTQACSMQMAPWRACRFMNRRSSPRSWSSTRIDRRRSFIKS